MIKEDWKNIERIYFEGLETGNATFQLDIPIAKNVMLGILKLAE